MHPFAKLARNPLLVVGDSGQIVETNAPARRLVGARAAIHEVFADAQAVEELLWRASGSSDPVLGALEMCPGFEPRTAPVSAIALRDGASIRYVIELRRAEDNQFAFLTQRVDELNAEIAERRLAQAQLEEALAHNQILYRELQHRVKNHLQMMLALVSAAGRESADPGNRAFVSTLQSKLSALFDAQRLMYADPGAHGVRADQMLQSVAQTVQSLAKDGVTVDVHAERLIVPNDVAFPVALIANELITNAVKYGAGPGADGVVATLERQGDEICLRVQDHGPGFAPPAAGRTSSGLGLVRGLCRQIGGRLHVDHERGAVVSVSFPIPEALHVVG